MKVLLVEDDGPLAEALSAALADAGVLIESTASGTEADFLVQTEHYDAVILDLGLPDGDGTRWLAQWREAGIDLPVLVLTARERWADKLPVSRPAPTTMSPSPSRLRRCSFGCVPDASQPRPCPSRAARRGPGLRHPYRQRDTDWPPGQPDRSGIPAAGLSGTCRARVVSRAELAEHVYDRDHEPDSNVIDVQISRLRRKLGSQRIQTQRGQGYRLVDLDEAS